jgi:hypothetical protein
MSAYIWGYRGMVVGVDDEPVTNYQDARGLARLIVSRRLRPPFVLGVFGPRATAKTTFLHTLSREVQDLASQPKSNESDFLISKVISVHYNAWHGAPAGPVIGLAERVFGKLEELNNQTEQSYPFYEIDSVARLWRDANSKIEVATDIVKRTKGAVKVAEDAHRGALKSHADASAYIKWADAAVQFHKNVAERDPDILTKIDRAGSVLGLRNLANDPDSLNRILDEAKTVGGQASLLTSVKIAKRYIGTVVLLILALILLLSGIYVAVLLGGRISDEKDLIDALTKILAGASALIGLFGVVGVAITQNRASRAIADLQKYEPLLRQAIFEVDRSYLLNLAIAKETMDTLRSELTQAQARLAEALRDLSLASQQRADAEQRGILLRLLQRYRERQSVGEDVSGTIREDFESLSFAISHSVNSDLRVVVYIDGLDRCRPSEVVKVTEAIRLLLLLETFIVVLPVDPAWIIHSFKTAYQLSLTEGERPSSVADDSAGYELLSQLIDIPFWPDVVNTEAAARYFINDLMHRQGIFAQDDRLHMTAAPSISPVEIEPFTTEEVAETHFEVAEIHFTAGEWDLIGELSVIRRMAPRKLMRLINVYTVIRATLSPLELRFLEGQAGYRALLVHLFVSLSPPDVSGPYLIALARHGDFKGLMDSLRSGKEESASYREMIEALDLYRRLDSEASIGPLRDWSFRVRQYGWLDPHALEESVRAYL